MDLLKKLFTWIAGTPRPEPTKTTHELECEVLIAEMKRCGFRVLMSGRANPADDYPYYGPGWFIGTNTHGDGRGFYIHDKNMAQVIVALHLLPNRAYLEAERALDALCEEQKAELTAQREREDDHHEA